MKIVVWGVFAFVALVWTGGAALLAQLVQWSAQGLAGGGAASIGAVVAAASMPSWLSPWIDAVSWRTAQEALGSVLASLLNALPGIGDALTWLVPAIWAIWGLGLLIVLGLTLLGVSLLGRFWRGFGAGPRLT